MRVSGEGEGELDALQDGHTATMTIPLHVWPNRIESTLCCPLLLMPEAPSRAYVNYWRRKPERFPEGAMPMRLTLKRASSTQGLQLTPPFLQASDRPNHPQNWCSNAQRGGSRVRKQLLRPAARLGPSASCPRGYSPPQFAKSVTAGALPSMAVP